jgi:hypothetical protein
MKGERREEQGGEGILAGPSVHEHLGGASENLSHNPFQRPSEPIIRYLGRVRGRRKEEEGLTCPAPKPA